MVGLFEVDFELLGIVAVEIDERACKKRKVGCDPPRVELLVDLAVVFVPVIPNVLVDRRVAGSGVDHGTSATFPIRARQRMVGMALCVANAQCDSHSCTVDERTNNHIVGHKKRRVVRHQGLASMFDPSVLLPVVLATAALSTESLTAYPTLTRPSQSWIRQYPTTETFLVVILASLTLDNTALFYRVDLVKITMGIALFVLCMLNSYEASEEGRIVHALFDSFVVLVLVASTALMTDDDTKVTAALHRIAASVLTLFSARTCRKALGMCEDLSRHTTIEYFGADRVITRGSGCIICNLQASLLLSFISMSTFTGSILLIARKDEENHGLLTACVAIVQLVGVFSLYLLQSGGFEWIPSLFSSSTACDNREECPVVYELRRIYLTAHSVGSLTFSAFAVTVLAVQQLQRSLRSSIAVGRVLFLTIVVWLATIVATLVVIESSGFSVSSVEVSILVILMGVCIGSVVDELVGSFFVVTGMLIDFVLYYIVRSDMVVTFTYFTIVSNLFAFCLYAVLMVLVIGWEDRLKGRILDLIVAGRSITWALAVATTGLLASYDGTMPPVRGPTEITRSALAFVVWHYAPICTWVMLSQRLVPTQNPQSYRRRMIVWIGSLVVLATIYAILIAVTSSGSLPSDYPLHQPMTIATSLVVIVLPAWLGAI